MITINGKILEVTKFPDGTSQVWKIDEHYLKHTDFVFIVWKFENESEFLHLAQLKQLLDQNGVRAHLKLDYLPYGRQDKDVSNNATFALHTFSYLLNKLYFDTIRIADPHSKKALELITSSWAFYPIEKVKELCIQNKIDVLCYPDKGAKEKYSALYDEKFIYGEKVRNQETGHITSYELIGDPSGKNVMIVDDICDGGATFTILAKDLLAKGAKSVVLFVTHGIFSKGTKVLFESGIQRIFTKDGEVSKY